MMVEWNELSFPSDSLPTEWVPSIPGQVVNSNYYKNGTNYGQNMKWKSHHSTKKRVISPHIALDNTLSSGKQT